MAESNEGAKLQPVRGRKRRSSRASRRPPTSPTWLPRDENEKRVTDNHENRFFVVETKLPLSSANIPEHWLMIGEIESRFVLSSGIDNSPPLLGISENMFIELASVDEEISRNDEASDLGHDAETENMDFKFEVMENLTDANARNGDEKDVGFLTLDSVLGETNGRQTVTTNSLRELVSAGQDVYVIYPCEEEVTVHNEKLEETVTVSTILNDQAQEQSTVLGGSRATKIELVRAEDLDSQLDGLAESDVGKSDDDMYNDDGKIDDDDDDDVEKSDSEGCVIDASTLPVFDASEMEVMETNPHQNDGAVNDTSTFVVDTSKNNTSTFLMDGDEVPEVEPQENSGLESRSSQESTNELVLRQNEELKTRKAKKRKRKDESMIKQKTEKLSSYPCDICGKRFRIRSALRKHRVIHDNKREHICEICGRGFHFPCLVTAHIRKVHERAEQRMCEICGLTLGTTASYKNHMLMHSGEKSHMCDVCGKGFSQRNKLQDHIATVHTDDRPHMCSHCGKSYKTSSGLNHHIREKHSPEGPTAKVCETCGESFASVTGLHKHKRRLRHGSAFLASQTFACEVCGQDFATFKGMQLHKRSHERPPDPCLESLECEVCGKKCKNLAALKYHRRNHYKEKNKVCEICGKKFMDTGNLKTHMRIHTGEKPYECPRCYKRFVQVCGLNAHGLYCKARHPVKQTFTCSVCDRVFNRFVNLCKHLVNVHNLEAPVDANPRPGFSSAFAANAALDTIVAGN